MRQILSITRKELEGYFSSPLALLFMGAFLAVELFIFFTVETFFARGVADVRPLFAWMPILLIFLLAALTMRQWSEEMRSGTMEILLTLPVDLLKLVLGKFLAVLAMIGVALALTLPIPITVSLIGTLDWGPVIGGYTAGILMASAYAAIGLFISSRTDNQIVALISTVFLGGLFYLFGSRGVTDLFGGALSSVLWALGTGSRFESIQRGVVDLRDLAYYLSLSGIFLTLNILSLDSIRWSRQQEAYQRRLFTTASLITLNLVLLNVWLFPLQGLRLDLTAQKEYTLSQVSKDLLTNLNEPLLIRAYISERTHPLLAPLALPIRDMLREYEIASRGMVTAEVIDPANYPDLEAEANQTYGIHPTPFQVSGRYEASVINSYFDILVRYGDQSVVLNFSDLIEVEQKADGIDVRLKNLEYDLTGAVKKVVFGFQSVDAVLAALNQPVLLTLYVTPDTLPESQAAAVETVQAVVQDIQSQSRGKLEFQIVNPDDPNSGVTRQMLLDKYGLQPIPADIFSTQTYFLHMVLINGEQGELIYPSGNMSEGEVRTSIESALKRTSTGFLKVVGLWTPPQTPTQDMFGNAQQPLSSYQLISQQFSQDYNLKQVDLSSGEVSSDIDVLLMVAPENLTPVEAYAVDQYLMRGGSVIIAASNYKIAPDQFTGSLALQQIDTGLNSLLAHYGVTLGTDLVMDKQNMPFPLLVNRNVGGFQVQEIQGIDYPYFVEVFPDGMNSNSPMMAGLATVTLNWAAPVIVDETANANRETTVLLNSSADSWLRSGVEIQPNFDTYPDLGFPTGEDKASQPLAVSIQGSFESYFKDNPLPQPADTGTDGSTPVQLPPVVENSPDSARLVVVGSASFVDDFVLQLASRLSQDRVFNNLLFVQNAVDWSVEDLDLLTIRSRGTYTRLLRPMEKNEEVFWEVFNYAIALAALGLIYFSWRMRRRNEAPMELQLASERNK